MIWKKNRKINENSICIFFNNTVPNNALSYNRHVSCSMNSCIYAKIWILKTLKKIKTTGTLIILFIVPANKLGLKNT